jgi:molybdate transport system permease protein
MVSYGADVVTDIATPSRHVGYVPQNLGLFPGRTVWQQLLFATDSDATLAAWWLQTLQLDGLQDRLPHQLSGGQRQRVSLAQALSHRPRVVLLDEPFSALDAPVREELRDQLRRLQRDSGLSTVLVTHDPEEAALLADEILVIDDGRLLQAGTRAEVYNRPASPQVARLLGIPNLNRARVSSATAIRSGELLVAADAAGLPVGGEVLWCVRPDRVHVDADGPYPATVIDVADIGTQTLLTIALAGGPQLRVRTTDVVDLAEGDACRVELSPAAITMWPA